MPKQISALLLVFFLCSHTAFSQKFMQGAGATASILFGKNQKRNPPNDVFLSHGTFTYFPRYNIAEHENSSISVGLPFGVGIGIVTNLYDGGTGISFAYDVASVVDYNIGCKSTKANEKSFGGYMGVGFGYFHVGGSDKSDLDYRGASYGPLVRGGLRFLFTKTRMAGHALNTGLFYKKGLETSKLSTIGLTLLWE